MVYMDFNVLLKLSSIFTKLGPSFKCIYSFLREPVKSAAVLMWTQLIHWNVIQAFIVDMHTKTDLEQSQTQIH